MIGDVQISRVHKSSPFNVVAFVADVTGTDEHEILNQPQIQELINKTFGNKLVVSVLPHVGSQKDFIIKREPKKNLKQLPMKQLIKITEQNGNRVVSARELHYFLEVKTDFTDWTKRMLEYGFDENIDFWRLKIGERNAHNKTDYALTIDTAKEIAMIQRTPRGKEVRQYFIEMEKVAISKILQESNCQKIGRAEKQDSVLAKKHELLELIKYYLMRGDIEEVARKLNCSVGNIKGTLYGGRFGKKVFTALYEKALENKDELLFDYQSMIDTLKK